MKYVISFLFLLLSNILFSQFNGKTELLKFGTKNPSTGKFEWQDWVNIDPIKVFISSDSVVIYSLTKQFYYVDKINDNLKSGEAMVLDVHNLNNDIFRVFL